MTRVHLDRWDDVGLAGKIAKVGWHAVERARALAGWRHPDLRIPDEFKKPTVVEVLRAFGHNDIKTLDFFDARADIIHDMNTPLAAEFHDRFNTVIDIGSLEHVFDTRQCIANLFAAVRLQGHIMLHTPCRGYFSHGFHTFSPECICEALRVNGFDIRSLRYSTGTGRAIDSPAEAQDVLLWVIARKVERQAGFIPPQQGVWVTRAGEGGF
jgi:hypothetical protein